MTETEQWRPVVGYEGLYEVSNLGRVKSLERIDNRNHLRYERILSLGTTHDGYFKVGLNKEGKRKWFSVHRLVAKAFIPNPKGLPVINHKDENPKNNVVFLKDDGSVDECRSNLEWCDCKYNNSYGTHTERIVQTMIKNGKADPELCGLDKKERDHLYYQKNRDKKLEQQREYSQKNRDRIREYQREYRQKNRDKKLEQQREYRRRKKQEKIKQTT